jgi:hypothetical protein
MPRYIVNGMYEPAEAEVFLGSATEPSVIDIDINIRSSDK